jgi:hypothetical protein
MHAHMQALNLCQKQKAFSLIFLQLLSIDISKMPIPTKIIPVITQVENSQKALDAFRKNK